MSKATAYMFDVKADYDINDYAVQIISAGIATVWQYHIGLSKCFDVQIYARQISVSPDTPYGVPARFLWEPEIIQVWPQAVEAAAVALRASYPLMLCMYSAHEAMHAVQKARGEQPFESRLPNGNLVAGYVTHPLDVEAREAGMHAIKCLEGNLTGSIVLADGTREKLPTASMFRSIPKNRKIEISVP